MQNIYRMKNGVINVYKEEGMTSFQVVYRIRKITGEQKVGHTGTLDPDACGVLPVCIGKATKLVDFLMDSDKQYKAVMILGLATDTQDISGKVLASADEIEIKDKVLSKFKDGDFKSNIIKALDTFKGDIEQLPPMYSALKVNGVKLVDAARRGKEIERKSRIIHISDIKDIEISDDYKHISFTVDCSKGTYIRTLCEDIGEFFDLPACMESLERTRTSSLDTYTSLTLSKIEEFNEKGILEDFIIPTDYFLDKYPKAYVKDEAVKKLIYGNWLGCDEVEAKIVNNQTYRMYDNREKFYALYKFDDKDNYFKCEKMFV